MGHEVPLLHHYSPLWIEQKRWAPTATQLYAINQLKSIDEDAVSIEQSATAFEESSIPYVLVLVKNNIQLTFWHQCHNTSMVAIADAI